MSIHEKFEQLMRENKYPDRKQPKELFNIQLQEYRQRGNDIHIQFKIALFEEHDVLNNPKAEKCFSLAWEHGHSYGLSEVETYFNDFVELIK